MIKESLTNPYDDHEEIDDTIDGDLAVIIDWLGWRYRLKLAFCPLEIGISFHVEVNELLFWFLLDFLMHIMSFTQRYSRDWIIIIINSMKCLKDLEIIGLYLVKASIQVRPLFPFLPGLSCLNSHQPGYLQFPWK